jgi:hypothetical protein
MAVVWISGCPANMGRMHVACFAAKLCFFLYLKVDEFVCVRLFFYNCIFICIYSLFL